MSRKYRSGTIRVKVDCSDVLDEIDTEELIAELQTRGKSGDQLGEFQLLAEAENDLVREAYEECLRGRASHAAALLSRALFPKTGTEMEKSYRAWQKGQQESRT
jgi:pullulanase/glycogen debranching enzyme